LENSGSVKRAISVVVNAASGGGNGEREIARLQEIFRQAGLDARILPARSGGELRSIVKSAMRDNPAMVVAGGGDGTVSTVASLLRGSGIALGVLPLGTLNHFARDLGIPLDLGQAVATLAAGHVIDIDVGEVNGKTFLNNSSLGIYPDMVRDRDRQQRRLGRGKRWAMVWATITALRRSPFLEVSLTLDGKERSYRTPFVFIGNNSYLMEGFDIGRRESLRDGRLSIYVTQRRTRLGLIALGFLALFARLRQARDFEALTAQSIGVRTRRKHLHVATDGEVSLMETPLAYRVVPRDLRVVAPAPTPAPVPTPT
jgi:YegS/Rv2252/BmrU family lipid kinase